MRYLPLFTWWMLFLGCFGAFAQEHQLQVQYDSLQQTLEVRHQLKWVNRSNTPMHQLVLLDWNHAYSNNQTPLAQRLTEEFDRSFYLSKRSKFGATEIHQLQMNGQDLNWSRPEDHPDILILELPTPLLAGDTQTFEFRYTLKLPASKFTGYGYKPDGSLSLKYWHLMPAPQEQGEWKKYSHLHLDDYGGVKNRYTIAFSGTEKYEVLSNLNTTNSSQYTGEAAAAFFDFVRESDFQEYTVAGEKTVITDFDSRQRSKISRHASILRITDYFEKVLGIAIPSKLWVQKAIYNRYPFYGLNQLPEIVSPFSDEFHFEVRFLKAFAFAIAEHQLMGVDRRKNYGLFHGLQIYWILKYMEAHHPDQKFIGRLAEWKVLKPYEISRLPFNGGFWFLNTLTQTANLQQADRRPADVLTRFNARISVPYHMGLGWFYLDHYLGGNRLVKQLNPLYAQGDLDRFQSYLEASEQKSFDWLFTHYFGDRFSYDIRLEVEEIMPDSIQLKVSEKSGLKLPYRLDWVQKNGQIQGQWMESQTMEKSLVIPRSDAPYLSVNAQELWPDQIQKNHWRKNRKFQLKPLRLTFLKDLQSPKANQVFFNPSVELNAYDGFALGMQFYNKAIRQPNFEFNVSPQYSSIEKKLVGSFRAEQRIRKENSSNFLTLLSVFGSQYHYDQHLKYSILAPSLSFFFRPKDLRSNYRERLSFAYYQVHRELAPNTSLESPNYQIFNIGYQQSNRAAVNFMSRRIDMDFSKDMGKLYASWDHRKLFPSGRQLSLRLFGGLFLYHNRLDIPFYDFNLNRPTDYLFRYAYLGRSETSGLLGQQFIPAEGSFKSIIEDSSANDFLISTNLAVGLWRWVEAYVDLGLIRNRKTRTQAFYGTGIRLNLLPDYLELYLPVASNNGIEDFNNQYFSNIRVLFTLDPKTLSGLFTRSWF